MPQPKKHETTADRVKAWQAEKVDRIPLNIRRDAELNKATIQKAADAVGAKSVAEFIAGAIAARILRDLGQEWIDENGNHPPAGVDK